MKNRHARPLYPAAIGIHDLRCRNFLGLAASKLAAERTVMPHNFLFDSPPSSRCSLLSFTPRPGDRSALNHRRRSRSTHRSPCARWCFSPAALAILSTSALSTAMPPPSCDSRPIKSMTSSRACCLRTWMAGRVTSVTYGSQGPLSHTLQSFQVDITSNPPLAELLNQLRGARSRPPHRTAPLRARCWASRRSQRQRRRKEHRGHRCLDR